ncbi:hypothetical protein So717_14310 [Roseobacter cerasinus]|uniref:Sulfotransferase family protein n=1 Tax=Roseobacter cerasinus TaxID=2602289 RepID=A0A640VMI1_9RHOB|nr:hypothetical protein [Roseobacter cerasinus]GFE49678.1 hypothetical protein So717_14310 [Roseobacter cerasinus]
MNKIILHIGAHRTGTTSLQRFLRNNADLLTAGGIETLCPPESRHGKIADVVPDWLAQLADTASQRFLISEENLPGTMGHNIATGSLYPNAKENLGRLASLYKPDVVMMSVRELGEYWTSAILFSLARHETTLPSQGHLNAICSDKRSWRDVVADVQSVFPHARLVVREFAHLQDNPKRFLRLATGWDTWADAKLNRRAQNVRPDESAIVSALLERGDFGGLARLGDTKETQIFSRPQRQALFEIYQSDLDHLRKLLGASFLESRKRSEGAQVQSSRWRSDPAPARQDETVFLRIGRTGGRIVQSLASADAAKPDRLHLGNHDDTLISTINKFGRTRKLAFFFRDPVERFVSGFNARLRQGRPRHNVNWTTAEAVAFSLFRTPDALGEALSAQDDYLKSAARFSMASICHLKHDYVHYLHSPDAVRYEMDAGNLIICCETDRIDNNIRQITDALHLSTSIPVGTRENTAPIQSGDALSRLAVDNLKRFCPQEFEIYAACKMAAAELGFT